jgi:hypothetical protein
LQGRPLADKKAPRPVPIIRHPDVRRMILAQKAIAEGGLALCLYSARLVDTIATAADPADRDRAQRLLDILTPVTKSWPSEQGPIANSLAIQVHGGYGYTRDFDVEQLYRDTRLNPIHEGTTGIQALDLLGRKILLDGGANFHVLRTVIQETEARASKIAALQALAQSLAAARQSIESAIDLAVVRDDTPASLAHATAFLSAFGHLVVAWIWLDMTEAAHRLDIPQAEAKLWTCRYFYDVEVPLIPALLAPMTSGSTVTAGIPERLL